MCFYLSPAGKEVRTEIRILSEQVTKLQLPPPWLLSLQHLCKAFLCSSCHAIDSPNGLLSLCLHKSALTHTTNLPQKLKSLKFVAAVAVLVCLHLTFNLQNSDYFHKLQSVFIYPCSAFNVFGRVP